MKKSTIVSIFVVATAVLTSATFLLTNAPAYAWAVNHSADAICKDNRAVVNWTFKNTEPNLAKYAITLEVTDAQTNGKTVESVAPGQSASGTFSSVKTKLSNGDVSFKMTWTDGRSGIDTRTSSYVATPECYVAPEQPAFDANVICTVIDNKATYRLRITQTAGSVDGIFTPANGDTISSGNAVTVLGIFNQNNSVEKIVVTTENVADCTPKIDEIEVCRGGKIVSIAKKDKRATDTEVCPIVKVEKEKPTVLASATELPKTGAGSVVALVGATFTISSSLAYGYQKRKS